MAPKFLERLSNRTIVLMLLAIATLVKMLWAVNSVGTTDAVLYYHFGESIALHGMKWGYSRDWIYDYTPFTGWVLHGMYVATGHNYMAFAALLRLLSILADIAVVLGLLHLRELTGKPPWWALCLFAASPVSIMVSGFHGQVDPVMLAFLFFAAVAAANERPVLCGLLFAAACNIKIVPLLVAPVFIFFWMARGRRAAFAFMATSGAIMLAGILWGLINCPAPFLRHVFGYDGIYGGWGFTYWLRQTGIKGLRFVFYGQRTVEQTRAILVLKVILLAGVAVLAWRRRKLGGIDFFTTLGAAFTWIFVFAPGLGPQYMVWFAPFVLIAEPGWWLALTAGASIFMARFYHSTSQYHFPWDMSFPKGPETPYWAPWTNLAWGTFIVLLCRRAPLWLLLSRPEPAREPAPPVSREVCESV